eukprot:s493_g2.t2
MHLYGLHVPGTWLCEHLTIFADDVHLCQLIHNATDLQTAIDRFGAFIQCVLDLGLRINFKKTEVLLRLAGPQSTLTQSRHILRTAEGVFLKIPYGNGLVAHVPMRSQVTYLGVKITYQNLQKATVDHRISAGRHIFRRLRVWLSCSSHIPLQKRYQLWKATVFSAMTYGIFTVGLMPSTFTTLQAEIMRQLRQLAGNYAQITEQSHSDFLFQHGWPSPAQLLLTRVEGMIARLAARAHTLATCDIVLQHDWHHLQSTVHLLQQAVALAPTQQAFHSALDECAQHQCFLCNRTFSSVRARRMHMWREHHCTLHSFRAVNDAADSLGGMPFCKLCNLEFSTWQRFHHHMALHFDTNLTQVALMELDQQLQAADPVQSVLDSPRLLAAASAPAQPMDEHVAQPAVLSSPSPLFANARATAVGARALQLVTAQDWSAIRSDVEVKQWLCTHCTVCNIYVGNLKRMNSHMRQQHPDDIDGLFQTACTVLKRCGTTSPCEYCNKLFQHEHLCPAMVQAAMILLHEMPSAAGASGDSDGAPLSNRRTRRLIVHDFVLARDSTNGISQCSHCHRKFDTLNGLRIQIVLGKCNQFDINRSQTPIAPDADLLQHLKTGTLMEWLSDPHRRMQWTCHCKTCGMRFTGASQLANHMQMTHAAIWHAATACTSFLSAYVHTIHRCVCNPCPGTLRNEHQCLLLRQIAMQYVRARDEGTYI